jgi:hypothetical protein
MSLEDASEVSKLEFCQRVAELYKEFPENKSRIAKELGLTKKELEGFSFLEPIFDRLREEELDDIAERVFKSASGKGLANYNLTNGMKVLATFRNEWSPKRVAKKEKPRVESNESEEKFNQVLEKMGKANGTGEASGRVVIRT